MAEMAETPCNKQLNMGSALKIFDNHWYSFDVFGLQHERHN